MAKANVHTMETLPGEAIHQILSHLDLRDVNNLLQVFNVYEKSSDLPDHVWRHLVLNSAHIPHSIVPVEIDGRPSWNQSAKQFLRDLEFLDSYKAYQVILAEGFNPPSEPESGKWLKQTQFVAGTDACTVPVRAVGKEQLGFVIDYKAWTIKLISNPNPIKHKSKEGELNESKSFYDGQDMGQVLLTEKGVGLKRKATNVTRRSGQGISKVRFEKKRSKTATGRGGGKVWLSDRANSVGEYLLCHEYCHKEWNRSWVGMAYLIDWEKQRLRRIAPKDENVIVKPDSILYVNGLFIYRNADNGEWTAYNPFTKSQCLLNLKRTALLVHSDRRYCIFREKALFRNPTFYVLDCVERVMRPVREWADSRPFWEMVGIQQLDEDTFALCGLPSLSDERWAKFLRGLEMDVVTPLPHLSE